MLAVCFYGCIAAVRRPAFPSACFCSVYFLVTAAQWLTTSAACSCTAAASRLPILRCMQRYELQSYDEMQAPSQPGKLVHHHASTLSRALPSTLRCAANATRHTRRARGRVTRNPYPGKKAVGIDTRILACERTCKSRLATPHQPTPSPRPII